MGFDVKAATTKELVAKYNELTGKKIKKFASRAAGESQVARMLKTIEEKENAVSPAEHKNRSMAARESWNSTKVAKARATRDGVKVEGHGTFKSVAAAFKELRLPLAKHIPFRGVVKKEGHATFTHGDKKYKFTIAPKTEAA